MKNKEVLITGASGELGKECAIYLANSGYDIVLHCNKNIKKAEEIKKEIEKQGQNARILQFDVTDRKMAADVLLEDIEQNGVYFGIVLCAGTHDDNIFPIMEDNQWDSVINTNLNGFYNVLKPLVMPLIQAKNKGRIITMSSVSGLRGNRAQINYSAAKAGIIGATKTLSLELAKRQITVNCIAPGVIESEMTKDLDEKELNKIIPMKRYGTAKEVASLVNYLMSEDAGYITGQVISVNGGLF